MKTLFVLCTLLSAQLFYLAQAQQPASPAYAAQGLPEASFAVVVDSKVLTTEGDWKQSTRLREYAMTRPGTYIVFAMRNGLALLTNAGALSKAFSLYQEVARLGNEQKSLAAKQAPLTRQQEALAAKMKKAVSPEEMRRIGAEQGRIGLEQGAIGRDQGRVGQEQGVAGRAFYDEVQASLKTCMRNQSCTKVWALRSYVQPHLEERTQRFQSAIAQSCSPSSKGECIRIARNSAIKAGMECCRTFRRG